MTIRPAQPADAPAVMSLVTRILAAEFPADQSAYATDDLEKIEESYAGPSSTFLVAEEDRRIVGSCGVKAESGQTAILRRLFVDPQCRGRGVGMSLLKQALQFCRGRGFREVVIRTSARMEQAIRLCKSLGFLEDGRWTLGSATLLRFRLRLT
ncbi:MAG: GNAT family N-acetyltransferase [Candidatus Omnitrophica bacterium]|nr:GNAT family N-acetyltransferase [Candidatus Omnitrophota bacterium]